MESPDFEKIGRALQIAPPIELSIDSSAAIQIVGLMQLALRCPGIEPVLADTGREIVNMIGDGLAQLDPEVGKLVAAGWSAEQDVTGAEMDEIVEGDFNIVEVHNAFTVYEMEADGTLAPDPMVALGRAEDWGDRQRWAYGKCTIKRDRKGPDLLTTRYVQHCHVWREHAALCMKNKTDLFQDIGGALFMLVRPGMPETLCNRDMLSVHDEWLEGWGEMPPHFEVGSDPDFDGYALDDEAIA